MDYDVENLLSELTSEPAEPAAQQAPPSVPTVLPVSTELYWTTQKRQIKDLIPFEVNPRSISNKAKKDLRKSLKKFNLAEIPAINTDNKIIAGHQRIAILLAIGRDEETIDVRVPSRELTSKECEEYNIRSNANVGEWDFEKLSKNFLKGDLLEWGFPTNLVDSDKSVSGGPVEVAENLPEYLTFVVTPEQRGLIESRLDACPGENRTEQLLSLCKPRQ